MLTEATGRGVRKTIRHVLPPFVVRWMVPVTRQGGVGPEQGSSPVASSPREAVKKATAFGKSADCGRDAEIPAAADAVQSATALSTSPIPMRTVPSLRL
jgi:hypothetical protein